MRNKVITCIMTVVILSIFYVPQGWTAVDLKDIETAIIKQDFLRARNLSFKALGTDLDKNDANEVYYYLGLSSLRLGDYYEARETFQKLIKSISKGTMRDKAYLGLFDSYYLDGEYKQALKTAKKLIKKSRRSEFLSISYLKLARANLKLARWSDAQNALNKIVNNFPESLEFHIARQLLEEKQYFAVQVGAFMDRNHAEKLALELKQKQEYAYIVETIDHQERKFYRVRVGQMALLDDAKQLKSKLSQEGYPARIYP